MSKVCNENKSSIKIYAFDFFYKQYKQYCTLQQRVEVKLAFKID